MIELNQEQCAQLAEALMYERPYKDQLWAKMALAVAARAIRRGRLLSGKEKRDNIMEAIRAMRFIVGKVTGDPVEYTFPLGISLDVAFEQMKRENPEWVSIYHLRYPIE